jgi:DNA-binding transcriptional ArsR family regulator
MFNRMVEHGATHLDATYGALAHPVRREMLRRLGGRDMRVTELAAHFDLSLAAASRHIAQLQRAGLVSRRIAGRDHWISIEAGPLQGAFNWLAPYHTFWQIEETVEVVRG